MVIMFRGIRVPPPYQVKVQGGPYGSTFVDWDVALDMEIEGSLDIRTESATIIPFKRDE